MNYYFLNKASKHQPKAFHTMFFSYIRSNIQWTLSKAFPWLSVCFHLVLPALFLSFVHMGKQQTVHTSEGSLHLSSPGLSSPTSMFQLLPLQNSSLGTRWKNYGIWWAMDAKRKKTKHTSQSVICYCLPMNMAFPVSEDTKIKFPGFHITLYQTV